MKRVAATMFAKPSLPSSTSDAAPNELPEKHEAQKGQMSAEDKLIFSNDFSFLNQLLAQISLHRENQRAQQTRLPKPPGNKANASKPKRNTSVMARLAGQSNAINVDPRRRMTP